MKILLVDNGQPFNLNTPYESPLGGSETSILLLAKGLAELGNQIIILSSTKINVPENQHNIILHNISVLDQVIPESDIIIFNRSCLSPSMFYSNKPLYCYCHDAYDQTHILNWMLDKNLVNRVSKFLCVSEWQKNSFIKYYNIPNDKMEVIGNSIDYSLFYGYTERNLNKLIFASIPYKGLEVLNDIFKDLCIREKRDNLEMHIFSSMSLYGNTQGDRDYERIFSELRKTKGVYLHKPLDIKSLAKELSSSSIYIHPCTYHESFGLNTVMAQASGCIPILVNNGANNEVVKNKETGFLTEGKTIFNINCYKEFLDLISFCLNNDLYKYRLKAQQFSKQWNYINVAKIVENIIRI